MEAFRKLRHTTWSSKQRHQDISPALNSQNSPELQNSPVQKEVVLLRIKDDKQRKSKDVSRSGRSSPGSTSFGGDTLVQTQSKHDNPLGMNVLYDPDGTPTIDIIFVHGLGGTSHHTWAKHKDPELFWPKEWLPQEPDICTARILSFGYSSTIAEITGLGTILNITDFAKDLLFGMQFGKNDELEDLNIGKVPIVFVVHSMGGLVVKKAYILGQNNPDHADIISSVSAILFLATPHRGSDLADTLTKILTVSLPILSSKQYLAELKRNSPTLEGINEDFRNIAPKLHIYSFYETKQTYPGLLVLNKDTSILGYPREVSKSLIADHHGVCKFSDRQDPDYVSVRNVLSTLVRRFREAKTYPIYNESPGDLKKIQTLLAVTEGPKEDFDFFHDRWLTGTCDWIKYDAFFKDWVEHTSSPKILWLHGHPASGKSVLSSFIIEYLESLDMPCSYFFFRFGDQTKRAPSALLRSIAYQMSQQLPEFRRRLGGLHDAGLRLEKTDARTIWNKVFVGSLFKMDLQDPLYWVVDALDESDSSLTLLDIFGGISQAAIPIHLLVVSRYTENLSLAFDRIEHAVNFRAQEIKAQESDIHLFVRKELRYLRGTETFKQRVLKRVLQRASGNFLWVTLAMQEIMKCFTEDAIEKALDEIPSGMEPLYQRMETNIARDLREGDKDLAKHILTWAACARRAMTLSELSQALESDFPAVLDLRHAIGEVCGQFVIVDSNSHVAMVHQTARDYLLKTPDLEFSIVALEAHRQLFTKSLSYLLDPDLKAKLGQIEVRTAFPFLQYAATCWPYHLDLSRLSRSSSASLLPLLAKFFRSSNALTWIHTLAYFDQLKILVQASEYLHTFASKKRKMHADDVPNKERIEDLELLESWAADILKVFAKFGPNLSQEPSAIYKLIPPFCPRESVLYRQHGKRDHSSSLTVIGLTNPSWDDCLAKISLGPGLQALQIECVTHYICILTTSGITVLCDSLTLKEIRRLDHGEFVFEIAPNIAGETLVTYGYHSTKVWSIAQGRLKFTVPNPQDCKALALSFTDNDTAILLGGNDKTIRKLDLQNPKLGWQFVNRHLLASETPIPGANATTPRYIAFSPDRSQVAVAYRGYPLSVWSMSEARPVARCRRITDWKALTDAWAGVDRVLWHPNARQGELLGLYNDGCVFKWNPSEDTSQEVRARASEFEFSPDGALFITSDITGIIKVWNYQHFVLIYQLSCEPGITGLCFSPDHGRFYDLSGSVCNVWEPNVLIRLIEIDERASEKESEAGSTTPTSSASEVRADTADPVTALAANSELSLCCAGNEVGVLELCDGLGSKTEIYHSPRFLTIDQVEFSQCGGFIAYSEIGGQVGIFRVTQGRSSSTPFQVESVREFKTTDGVHQLLFSPDSKFLLIAGVSSGKVWDVYCGTCIGDFGGVSNRTDRWFMNNPKEDPQDDQQFLDFDVSNATIRTWKGGDIVRTIRFDSTPPILSVSSDQEESHLSRRRSSPAGMSQIEVVLAVENVVLCQDKKHIMLHTTQSSLGSLTQSNIIFIENRPLIPGRPTDEETVWTVDIPQKILSYVRKPLGILPGQRMVYLDNESWVCTWRLGSANESVGLERHFFIPRDWLNAETLDLCLVMDDGTFLCPHYGEVAVIKSALGRLW